MNTSEAHSLLVYSKMCDHPIIQKDWKPQAGDFCYMDKYIRIVAIDIIAWMMKQDAIWLPRQDQIQKMMGELDNFQKIYKIAEYIEKHDAYYLMGKESRTMEQLWLSFYMHEKHELIWKNEKWIKEEKAKGR